MDDQYMIDDLGICESTLHFRSNGDIQKESAAILIWGHVGPVVHGSPEGNETKKVTDEYKV